MPEIPKYKIVSGLGRPMGAVREDASGYHYANSVCKHSTHDHLLPAVFKILASRKIQSLEHRIFDLGCGNGSVANVLFKRGWDVIGVDPSIEGITLAKRHYPSLKLYNRSAYDALWDEYGQFPIVLSLEVVEHVYFPRKYAYCVYSLVQRGGVAIISTPYHGYWVDLAKAVTGRMDSVFSPLWDYGHIKFWSMKTLKKLLLKFHAKKSSLFVMQLVNQMVSGILMSCIISHCRLKLLLLLLIVSIQKRMK